MGKKDIDGDVQHKEVVLPRRDTGKKNIDGSSPDEEKNLFGVFSIKS